MSAITGLMSASTSNFLAYLMKRQASGSIRNRRRTNEQTRGIINLSLFTTSLLRRWLTIATLVA